MGVLRPTDNDGWRLIPMHYSQDPEKSPEWAAKEKASYPTDAMWNREMEVDFGEISGVRAYEKFSRQLHVRPAADIVYNPSLPLCLCCDFNVGMMAWDIGQVVNDQPVLIDEITINNADLESMVREFRNRYPAHPAEVWVYGDATGAAQSVKDLRSNYDIIKLAFGSYSSPIVMKVPLANPPKKTRINSVNVRLRTPQGKPGAIISDRCVELIADFEEVLLDPKDGGDFQVRDPANPYSRRTHASAGVGYWWTREWPVADEVIRTETKPEEMPDLKFGRLPGQL